MSTPFEDVIVTFLKADGSVTAVVNKIYSDIPRGDLDVVSFPRAAVKERPSPSKKRGFGTSKRLYDIHCEILIFVDNDKKITISGTDYGPEQANSEIGYLLIDRLTLAASLTSLASSNVHILTTSYTPMGIDNEYFKKLDVYKGAVELTAEYMR